MFIYTPSRKKQAPSKEVVLQWLDRAWSKIPLDLITRSFKACGINNALNGTEDDTVWDDKEGDAEDIKDAEEPVDNEVETDSKTEDEKVAELNQAFKQTVLFRTYTFQFSINLFGKFEKVIFCCAKILSYQSLPEL